MPFPGNRYKEWLTWTKDVRYVVPQGKCRFHSEKMFSGQTKTTHVHSSPTHGDGYIRGHIPKGYYVYIFLFPVIVILLSLNK